MEDYETPSASVTPSLPGTRKPLRTDRRKAATTGTFPATSSRVAGWRWRGAASGRGGRCRGPPGPWGRRAQPVFGMAGQVAGGLQVAASAQVVRPPSTSSPSPANRANRQVSKPFRAISSQGNLAKIERKNRKKTKRCVFSTLLVVSPSWDLPSSSSLRDSLQWQQEAAGGNSAAQIRQDWPHFCQRSLHQAKLH